MNSRIQTLARKLELLRQKDTAYSIFGSRSLFGGHGYQLNPALSENEVLTFERLHQIRLPDDYRDFLTTIGNGGAGPGCGLHPLNFHNYPNAFLSSPFVHTVPFAVVDECDLEEEESALENEDFDDISLEGSIELCDYGCAAYAHLVITGIERGNVWVVNQGIDISPDDCRLAGIDPANSPRITFFEWYDWWLEQAIKKVS